MQRRLSNFLTPKLKKTHSLVRDVGLEYERDPITIKARLPRGIAAQARKPSFTLDILHPTP